MRFLMLLSVVLAACGGGGTSAPSGGATETGQPAAASQAPGGASAAPSGDAGPKFEDILRSGKTASYKVTYKMTTAGGGQSSATSEQTWYFKPPKTRLDMVGDDGYGSTTRISMFFLDTGSFMCTEAGGQKSCLQISADAAAGQNMGFEIQDSLASGSFDGAFQERRTIAGQQALCFVVRGAAALFTEGTFCYTQTGVPLLSTWATGGASFTMEATAFSATVADSDFTLPATPQKLP